jgi:hypothetical protein
MEMKGRVLSKQVMASYINETLQLGIPILRLQLLLQAGHGVLQRRNLLPAHRPRLLHANLGLACLGSKREEFKNKKGMGLRAKIARRWQIHVHLVF